MLIEMKRSYLGFVLLFVVVGKSFGQDAPPPEYLVKQDFPDSVASLIILKLDGRKVKFSSIVESYQGRKVVIDFWASWCRDCIVGLPKLDKLKQRTDVEKVVYVFISVDKEDAKWRSAINRFNISGEHYRIETGWTNTLSNYIDLDWIPRYLVLNENGRIIIPKAIVADDPMLEKILIK